MAVNGATFSCFDSLGLGALIAYLQYKEIPFKPRLYKTGLIISVVFYILLFISPGYLSPSLNALLSNFATSVVFFFIVMIAANNGFNGGFKSFLENRTILYFGRISYGLYLYHAFIPALYFGGINRFFPNVKSDADICLIYFMITIALASISWYLIERPILKLKNFFY